MITRSLMPIEAMKFVADLSRERPCRGCGAESMRSIGSADDFYLSGETFGLAECAACGLAQTVVEGPLDNYYPGEYYAHTPAFASGGRKEALQQRQLEAQRRGQSGVATVASRFMLVELPYIDDGVMVDVGCGAGKLLNVAAGLGYETVAAEPSAAARKVLEANGHRAFPSLADVELEAESVDVVVFNQSLEHIMSLRSDFALAERLLRPGGTLIVSVPNYGCNEQHAFGQYWRHLDVPRHVTHFTPATLRHFIENASNLAITEERFKFWGLPRSSFAVANEYGGRPAATRMAGRYLAAQLRSLVGRDVPGLSSMMSVYAQKPVAADDNRH